MITRFNGKVWGLVLAVWCGLASALTAGTRAHDMAVAKVCAVGYLAEISRDEFAQQNPAQREALNQVFASWREKHVLPALEKQLGAEWTQMRGKAETSVAQQRANFVSSLRANQKGKWAPADFAQMLEGSTFNLQQSMEAELALLATDQGLAHAQPDAGGTIATSQLSAQVKRYTVAQLAALFESVKAKTPGDGSVKRKRAEAALKSLGMVAVEGIVDPKRGVTLNYEDETWATTLNVYVEFRDDQSLKQRKGQKLVVLGRVSKVDTWIELADAVVVRDGASLAAANVTDLTPGLRRKDVDWTVFRVAPGKGIPANNIDGIYVRFVSGIGVGGMMIMQPRGYLVLRDGWIYDDPYLAPDAFNAELSREKEPQKWGRWKKEGKTFVIEWKERRAGDDAVSRYSDLAPLVPLESGAKLAGSLSSISGGGNTAFGGNTMVVASSDYEFLPDGRFSTGRMAGVSGGNDYTGNAPNVAGYSKSGNQGGSYVVSRFGIHLRFTNGETKSLIFAPMEKGTFGAALIGQSSFTGKGVRVM